MPRATAVVPGYAKPTQCLGLCTWYLGCDTHCWYIEPRNRGKSLRLNWQHFSCLLDEWIAKILKKKKITVAFWDNPHYPFWDAHGQSDKSENIFGIWY